MYIVERWGKILERGIIGGVWEVLEVYLGGWENWEGCRWGEGEGWGVGVEGSRGAVEVDLG